ncbi:hypothetical protein MHZ92_06325 [Sporosarcina sp. ACRSL]|uniref:hypothetical protein n=1 Tax=Sporosarcina sp. ACRSL TaxID=2918215 RepID=UPI001EF3DAB5|nr:hypothetical protein [Sporosarcina sp. ACRSL]MCG7343741.1 hypothetical protein [Sporosarcina sp. ACRSL]
MIKILDKIFVFSLIAFLTLGALLVFSQLAGLLFQQGEFIIKVNDLLAEPAIILSAVAGVLGFIIPAIKNRTSNILTEEEIEEQLLETRHSKVNA